MTLRPKHWALIGIVALALIVFAPSDNEGDPANLVHPTKQKTANAPMVQSPSGKRQQAVVVGQVELSRLERAAALSGKRGEVNNVFNTTSWYVPPPAPKFVPDNSPPPPPPPPPTPTAPPLPFTYFGWYNDERLIVILLKNDRVYTVAEGDVIENTYRVDKLAAGTVNVTYLPLNIAQTLRTGDTF